MDWYGILDPDTATAPWYSVTERVEAPLLIAIISLILTGIISFIAFNIARRIERRRIILEFLRELNSTEMMRDRHHTVLAIRRFAHPETGKQAFEREVRGFLVDSSHFLWQEGCNRSHFGVGADGVSIPLTSTNVLPDEPRREGNCPLSCHSSEVEFIRDHGLANFIYFIARVQICRDKHLLDRRLADAFLYSWFLHYYAFLERFVNEVERQLDTEAPIHRKLRPGWIGGLKAAVKQMDHLIKRKSLGQHFGRTPDPEPSSTTRSAPSARDQGHPRNGDSVLGENAVAGKVFPNSARDSKAVSAQKARKRKRRGLRT